MIFWFVVCQSYVYATIKLRRESEVGGERGIPGINEAMRSRLDYCKVTGSYSELIFFFFLGGGGGGIGLN